MNNEVYYKLMSYRNEKITVVCLQYFDEDDYDQKKFYGYPNPAMFRSEEDAIEFLNANFSKEYIDDEYLIPDFSSKMIKKEEEFE